MSPKATQVRKIISPFISCLDSLYNILVQTNI